jgi:ferredoxin
LTGIVTDACIKCKHMACVEVCPVDAFYEGENMLVINPLECVDCGCCIEECPIDAIAFDTDPIAKPWADLNAAYSKLWPNVTFNGGQTPDDAEEFHHAAGKFDTYFSPKPGNGDTDRPPRINQAPCSNCGKKGAVRRLIQRIWASLGSDFR